MKCIKIILLFLVATLLSVSLVYAAPPQGQWTATAYRDDTGLSLYWTHAFCFQSDGTWYATSSFTPGSGNYYKKGLSDKIHMAGYESGTDFALSATLELIRYGLMTGKLRYNYAGGSSKVWLQVEFVRTGDVCGPPGYSISEVSPEKDLNYPGK